MTNRPHAKSCSPRILRPETEAPATSDPRYTIATLVTDRAQYAAMLQTFRARGFTDSVCEFLFVDNTGPLQTDAFRGLNALLNAAHAPIVILCHQDVRLLDDGRDALDTRLSELSTRDPNWALAGNAGGVSAGRLALCLTDPHGKGQRIGQFPERVMSLDENFIVVRRDARIGFSNDLTGFHFYGADICLHASQMGYSAYVIDFHLEHLSPGKKDMSFAAAEQAFRTKWSRALTPRWIQTTATTPLRQLYFMVQMMLIDPSLHAKARDMASETIVSMLGTISNADITIGLAEVARLLEGERILEAMKRIRAMYPIEATYLANTTDNRSEQKEVA